MTESTPAESDQYSIVVVGAMNPAIHHPTWYRQIKLFSEDESENAKQFIASQVVAQFGIGDFVVVCTSDRWNIKTEKAESLDRLLEITCTVFEALDHTPVSAFGFNFNYNRRTNLSDVGQSLAKHLGSLKLGLQMDGASSADLRFQRSLPDRRVSVSIQPTGSDPASVLVAINFHYQISELNLHEHFDLQPLFRRHFRVDQSVAESQLSSVLSALSS